MIGWIVLLLGLAPAVLAAAYGINKRVFNQRQLWWSLVIGMLTGRAVFGAVALAAELRSQLDEQKKASEAIVVQLQDEKEAHAKSCAEAEKKFESPCSLIPIVFTDSQGALG